MYLNATQVPIINSQRGNIDSSPTTSLVVASCNGSFQGDCARYNDGVTKRPISGLYYKDHERGPAQIRLFEDLSEKVGLSLVGGQEFFDTKFLENYYKGEGVKGFPYLVCGPSRPGLQAIADQLSQSDHISKKIVWRILGPRIQELVEAFFQSHYGADSGKLNPMSALKVFASEDRWMEIFQNWLTDNDNNIFLPPISSGLMLMSRYPIINAWFVPFDQKAEFERFTQKAILVADVLMPNQQVTRVVVTHLQDVVSKESQRVHDRQAKQVRFIIDHSPYPVILLGDLNAEPKSETHKRIFQAGLDDAHGAKPEFTFLKRNPIAVARGLAEYGTETDRCIDYIGSELPFAFLSEGLSRFAQVIVNQHSDHCIVLAKILFGEDMKSSGVRRIRPNTEEDLLLHLARVA